MYSTSPRLAVVPDPAPAHLEITVTIRVPAGHDQATSAATHLVRQLQSLAADTEIALAVPTPQPGIAAVPTPRAVPVRQARVQVRAASREVFRDAVLVPLTRLEYDLLHYLASHPRQVHRRSRLLRQVWDQEPLGHDRTIDVHVRRLRQKIGVDLPLIRTVRGVGYGLHAAADIHLDAGTD